MASENSITSLLASRAIAGSKKQEQEWPTSKYLKFFDSVKLEQSPLKSFVNNPRPSEREIEVLVSAVAVKQEHVRRPATIAATVPLEITPLKSKHEVRKEGERAPLATVWAAEEMGLTNEDRPRPYKTEA
jgi:hypothetical protein